MYIAGEWSEVKEPMKDWITEMEFIKSKWNQKKGDKKVLNFWGEHHPEDRSDHCCIAEKW